MDKNTLNQWRTTWVIVLVILALLFAGYVVYRNHRVSPRNTIKIGVVLPMTGVAQAFGEHQRNAIVLALEEVNASGGIDGKPIEAIYEDDQTSPQTSVTAVEKLISVDHTSIIIGGVWDFLANAVIPVIDKQKTILIAPSIPIETIQYQSPYFFSMYQPIAANKSVVEGFLHQFDKPRVAIVVVNNAWGKAHADMFQRAVESAGGTVIRQFILPNFDDNDLRQEIALTKSINPDAVLVAVNLDDSAVLAKEKSLFSIPAKLLSSNNMESSFYAGKIDQKFMQDVYIFRPQLARADFVAKYKKEFGIEPAAEADSAYDAVYAIKLALENAKNEINTSSIVGGFRKIADYNGASGKIDFTKTNYPATKTSILEVFEKGRFVKIGS